MKLAGLLLGAGLFLAQGGLAAQAPVVRKPPTPKGAQAPQSNTSDDQVPTLHVQTRLVNVVVNAVDASGSPVGGAYPG